MSKILLIDADSSIPNLALMKISTYHKCKNDDVNFVRLNLSYYPHKKYKTIDAKDYDVVYVSIIFTTNKDKVNVINCDNINYGGTGFNIIKKLPECMERQELDYSIYPDNDTSYGFITRGCIRNCYFCFVPKKEGKLYKENNWEDIVKHKKVKFMDNNFLAYSEHKQVLSELRDNKIKFQFNQGLDARLLDDENSKLLSECNYMGEYFFAFDDVRNEKIISEKITLFKKYVQKDWKIKLFIYCHPDMNIQNDVLYRIKWCKDRKILPYFMRDISCWDSDNRDLYIDLAAYCNQPSLFKKLTFEEFIYKRTKNKERINDDLKLVNNII